MILSIMPFDMVMAHQTHTVNVMKVDKSNAGMGIIGRLQYAHHIGFFPFSE